MARLQGCANLVRVLSRQPAAASGTVSWVTGDLATGAGLDAAVDGVDVVVHCATTNGKRDVETTDRLIDGRAGRRDAAHVDVHLDRRRRSDSAAVLQGETGRRTRGVRIRRAVLDSARDPVPRPAGADVRGAAILARSRRGSVGDRVPAIDVRDVASRLAEVVSGDPAGQTDPTSVGRRCVAVDDLARAYLRAARRRRWVLRCGRPGQSRQDTGQAITSRRSIGPDRSRSRNSSKLSDRFRFGLVVSPHRRHAETDEPDSPPVRDIRARLSPSVFDSRGATYEHHRRFRDQPTYRRRRCRSRRRGGRARRVRVVRQRLVVRHAAPRRKNRVLPRRAARRR